MIGGLDEGGWGSSEKRLDYSICVVRRVTPGCFVGGFKIRSSREARCDGNSKSLSHVVIVTSAARFSSRAIVAACELSWRPDKRVVIVPAAFSCESLELRLRT